MPGTASRIPLSQLGAEINRIAQEQNVQSTKPLMNDMAAYLGAQAKKRFQSGVDPGGTPWKPLAMFRARDVGSKGSPLKDRGLLMASMLGQGQPGSINIIEETRLEQGTNLDYAGLHQYGGEIRPKNAKALAIPLTPEAYRARSPRKMAGLKLIWPKGRKAGFLVEEPKANKKGKYRESATTKRKGVRTIFHFLLVARATIPARPFVGIGQQDADRLAMLAADYFARGGR